MKKFEEYWDFTGLSEQVYYIPNAEEPEQFLVEGLSLKKERKESWKAALEWIKESFDWTNNESNLSILLKELEGE